MLQTLLHGLGFPLRLAAWLNSRGDPGPGFERSRPGSSGSTFEPSRNLDMAERDRIDAQHPGPLS